jgi:hypothetical protein
MPECRGWRACLVVLVAGAASATVADAKPNGWSETGPVVKPAAVQERSTLPPPLEAEAGTTIGKGPLAISTADRPMDVDRLWSEEMDVDGDGQTDTASLLWDNESKVLYAYKDGTFTCHDGSHATGALLIAVNGEGNPWSRPPGSGLWLASLEKGKCNVEADGLWACQFNAEGAPMACGAATLDNKTNKVVIVAKID